MKDFEIKMLDVDLKNLVTDMKEIEMVINAILSYLDLDMEKIPMFSLRKKPPVQINGKENL